MNDVATTLQRLIIASEAVLALRNPGDPEQIGALCATVLADYSRPADAERVVHRYTIQLAEAVACADDARRLGRAHAEPIYFRIVGVILPDVRADFGKAIEQRKRPSP